MSDTINMRMIIHISIICIIYVEFADYLWPYPATLELSRRNARLSIVWFGKGKGSEL